MDRWVNLNDTTTCLCSMNGFVNVRVYVRINVCCYALCISVCLPMFVRGAHSMCCRLDELMTSLLCFLHDIIDQLCNTSDKKNLLESAQPFSFHATKCPVKVVGRHPAVLTFREGIFVP